MNFNFTFTVVKCASVSLRNGVASYNKSPVTKDFYPNNTEASLTCHFGYKLDGSSSTTCQTNDRWNDNTTTCTLKGTQTLLSKAKGSSNMLVIKCRLLIFKFSIFLLC